MNFQNLKIHARNVDYVAVLTYLLRKISTFTSR